MAEDDPPPEADRVDGHPHPREAMQMFGQDRAVDAFTAAWQDNRLHHAWLLRGPAGIGKATLAYQIARALIAAPPVGGLFAAEPRTLDCAPDCPIRARILAQSEPRLFVLRRQAVASREGKWRLQTQIAVDHVRAMRGFLQLSATDGGWRVVIADTADEMTTEAANALLKYLEEPPAQVLFLLVSHQPGGLLPTIRSRCRMLDLSALAPDPMARALAAAGAHVAEGHATPLAELAGGSAGQALRLIAHDGLAIFARLVTMISPGRVDRRAMLELSELCSGRDASPRFQLVLELVKTLLGRLSKAAATADAPPAAAPGEHQLMAAVAGHPGQAVIWAECLAQIQASSAHAVAVNLDPGQTVIDILLEIDATLARARAVPA